MTIGRFIIADVASLTLRINSSQAEAAAKRTERTLERLDISAKQVGRSMQSLGLKMSAAITAPFLLTARSAIKASAGYEKARISFGVFVGDMRKGAGVFNDIVKLASKTPLTTSGLQDAATKLLAMGAATADNVIPRLEMLGNVARADSNILQRLALNLGQVASKGKLTGREIMDFANAGASPIKALAVTLGKTTAQIEEMASAGKISFEDTLRAFKSMTSAGGRFHKLMERLSQTLSGKWTTAVDNVTMALAEFADVFKDEIKGVLDIVIRVAGWLRALSPEVKKFIVIVATGLAAIGPILLIIAGLGATFAGIAAAIAGLGVVIPIMLKIVAVLGLMTLAANETRKSFNMTWLDVAKGAGSFFGKVAGFFINFRENFNMIINWFKKNWPQLWRDAIANVLVVFRNLWTNIKIALNLISQLFGVFTGWVIDKFKELTTNLLSNLARWARKVAELFKEIGNKIAQAMRRGLTGRTTRNVDLDVFQKFIKGAAKTGDLMDRIKETWDETDFVPFTADVKWNVDPFPKLKLDGLKQDVETAKRSIFGIMDFDALQRTIKHQKGMLAGMGQVAASAEVDNSPINKLASAFEAGSADAFKLLTNREDKSAKMQMKNLNANQATAFSVDRLATDGIKLKGIQTVGSIR